LLGGRLDVGAGFEEPRPRQAEYDARSGVLDLPPQAPDAGERPDPRELRELIPSDEPGRALDDWGRSQRVFDLMQPLLDFYYRYWFRVDQRGVENVPAEGGALLVSNHSGALPPDAPMIMQAIRHEHSDPRPVYMLGEHWFKGYPGVGMLTNKIGLVAAHPANAQRLLRDEGQLGLVFPEGQKGSRKLYWQRYRLRRFGRGGFVRTAIRAQVPIVPIAVVGAEESMPAFAQISALQKLTGLLYFPITPTFPHFGLLGFLGYLPAKFKIRFLEPIPTDQWGPEPYKDRGLVQSVADDIRARIQDELYDMLAKRGSVWFG
jgi:1-acyl-sn-glycerol-3-phosphate acyltransferase